MCLFVEERLKIHDSSSLFVEIDHHEVETCQYIADESAWHFENTGEYTLQFLNTTKSVFYSLLEDEEMKQAHFAVQYDKIGVFNPAVDVRPV